MDAEDSTSSCLTPAPAKNNGFAIVAGGGRTNLSTEEFVEFIADGVWSVFFGEVLLGRFSEHDHRFTAGSGR